jgi:hypothetical protein
MKVAVKAKKALKPVLKMKKNKESKEAEDFASKTSKLINGDDLTMADQDINMSFEQPVKKPTLVKKSKKKLNL